MTQEIDLTSYRMLVVVVCPALLKGTNLRMFFELLSNITVDEMVDFLILQIKMAHS